MIQINRNSVDKPASLDKTNEEFRENDYKSVDVRIAIKNMQHRKCCYCERHLDDDLDEIEKEGEHFIPRTSPAHKIAGVTQWHKVNDWNNLMIACRACNGTKLGNPPFDDEGTRLIIDPTDSNIDPENEIKFNLKIDFFSNYDIYKSTELGVSTITKIGLIKRTFLQGKFRKARALINNRFDDLITAIENQDLVLIDDLKLQIKNITKASVPFAAFNWAVVKQRLEKFNTEDIPVLEEIYNRHIDLINIQFYKGYENE